MKQKLNTSFINIITSILFMESRFDQRVGFWMRRFEFDNKEIFMKVSKLDKVRWKFPLDSRAKSLKIFNRLKKGKGWLFFLMLTVFFVFVPEYSEVLWPIQEILLSSHVVPLATRHLMVGTYINWCCWEDDNRGVIIAAQENNFDRVLLLFCYGQELMMTLSNE